MSKITGGIIIKSASSSYDAAFLIAKAQELSKKNVVVQLFNPKSIYSRIHLLGAFENAHVAFDANENISKSMAMEMLLFAAMTRQIGDAVKKAGINDSKSFIVFSNSKKAYNEFSRLLGRTSDFAPGADKSKNADIEILQKMALSRIS